jgi:hypothetical protein
MARRLLGFALAFVIVGGPLAADVCEAVCAEHAGHSIASTVPASHRHHAAEAGQPLHHHGSDTATSSPTRRAGLMPLPQWCGYLEAIVTDSRKMTRPPIVEALVTTARLTSSLVPVLAASERDSRHGLPIPVRSTSPLRI